MEFDEFDKALAKARSEKPFRFAFGLERRSTKEEVAKLETALDAGLPSQYKDFLLRYGAGYIGDINLFSADPESEWYLPIRNRLIPFSLKFLAVSDDQTGGYYGFLMQDGKCSDDVYYIHLYDGDPPIRKAGSLLQFIVDVGLGVA